MSMELTMKVSATLFIGVFLSNHSVLGEWYHAANDSGRGFLPDVHMSMEDYLAGETGTFYYTKEGTEQSADITSSDPPVDDLLIDDGPDYLRPGMFFDGTMHVDLGPQRDSCFGNLSLCTDGWTMSFWMKFKIGSSDQRQTILDSGAAGEMQGLYMFTKGLKLSIFLLGHEGNCALQDTITEGNWFYVAMSYHGGKCRLFMIKWGTDISHVDKTASNDPGTYAIPDLDRMIIGAGYSYSGFPEEFGIFSMDELTVWYSSLVQVDASIIKFLYTYQDRPLGHLCENDTQCTDGMEGTQCRNNTDWGTNKYCQCIGNATLTVTYEECLAKPLRRCPQITMEHIQSTVLAIEAKKQREELP